MSEFTPIEIDMLGEIRGLELYKEFYPLYCERFRSERVVYIVREDSPAWINAYAEHLKALDAYAEFCKNKVSQMAEECSAVNDDKFCDSMLN